MSNPRRRLARIGSVVAFTIAVQLLFGVPTATATASSTTTAATTTTTTAGPTPTSTGRTAPSPAVPDCNAVLALPSMEGSLGKTLVGGDAQLGFGLWRIQTDRPAGVYHVVDCISADQVAPDPAVITTVDLGEVQVSGTATVRVDIPQSVVPGSDVCDRFVVSGRVGGVPFTDISPEVCTIYSSCVNFGPGTCPPEPTPTTGPVASTTPPRGTLPFTGSADWPLLITAVALLGLGVASLVVARWRVD
jgi:hypothetical protein